MDQEIFQRQELWDGWSLDLPAQFVQKRNADGSWSGWDQELVLDVVTLSTAGRPDGPISARDMLAPAGAHEYVLSKPGLAGHADLAREMDGSGLVLRLQSEVAAPNHLITLWFGFRDLSQLERALRIWRSVSFSRSGQP